MDRKALLQAIESKGQLNDYRATPEWKAAFEAYKKDTGDTHAVFSCGTCFKTVLKWLQK